VSLKARCEQWLRDLQHYAGDDVISPADQLVSFIVTEVGRMADSRLDNSVPLALYFTTEQDRAEFIEAVMEAKPGMIAKKWP
jgi:hypothetical protein